MGSSNFIPDLNNLVQYTPIKDLQPYKFYNIRGVLIDFSESIKRGQRFTFNLMDSSGKVEIGYYINDNRLICPAFSQNYQAVVIHKIQFLPKESGYIVGNLTINCSYRILTDRDITKYPEYTVFINIVRNSHSLSSVIPSENAGIQPAAKRIRYAEHTEPTQHQTSSEIQNQPILENNLIVSSKSALDQIPGSSSSTHLNSLVDIQPYNRYEIIAQVVKLEQAHPNRNQYIITDYSSSNKFRNTSIKLLNSKILTGKYFVNLTAWDDQKDSIEVFKFYKFSIVKVKLDKMGNIELNISGTKPNVESNITFPLLISQAECEPIKERMDAAIGSYKSTPNNSVISSEVIRQSKFCLIKDLKLDEIYDVALLVLKQVYNSATGNFILLCTDFTQNPILKRSPYINYDGIDLGSSMCIPLMLNGSIGSIIKNAPQNNLSHEIYQFLDIRVSASSDCGIELVLNSRSFIKTVNNSTVLNFDPIPKTDNKYYKEFVKRRNDYYNQFTRPLSPVIPAIRPISEQESQTQNSLIHVENSNIWENAIIISDSEEFDVQHSPKRIKGSDSFNSLIIISDDEEEEI